MEFYGQPNWATNAETNKETLLIRVQPDLGRASGTAAVSGCCRYHFFVGQFLCTKRSIPLPVSVDPKKK